MGGVSGLLSAVALLGYVLFILGIVLVVVSASQSRPVRNGVLLAIAGLVFGVVLSIVSSGVLIVEPTQVAVITNTLNGTLEEPERSAGTTVIVPIVQQATIYDTRQREYTMAASATEGARPDDDAVDATTIDGQQVTVDITLIYALNRTEANTVHLNWGKDVDGNDAIIEGFIRPTARTVVRDVIAQFQAESIYGAQRVEMQTLMAEAMREEMSQQGLTLSSFLVRGLAFSPEFTSAIEQKEIAEQNVQQAQQEAEQARTRAEGQRDAAILQAEGERDAAIALAEGQAQALQLVSEQLASNPSLIQYEYIRNLADNVSLVLLPSNSPFLFDLESLGVDTSNLNLQGTGETDDTP
jgi:regulator of protease activity HflC (stomatin/prohibitin superfamily)